MHGHLVQSYMYILYHKLIAAKSFSTHKLLRKLDYYFFFFFLFQNNNFAVVLCFYDGFVRTVCIVWRNLLNYIVRRQCIDYIRIDANYAHWHSHCHSKDKKWFPFCVFFFFPFSFFLPSSVSVSLSILSSYFQLCSANYQCEVHRGNLRETSAGNCDLFFALE